APPGKSAIARRAKSGPSLETSIKGALTIAPPALWRTEDFGAAQKSSLTLKRSMAPCQRITNPGDGMASCRVASTGRARRSLEDYQGRGNRPAPGGMGGLGAGGTGGLG